MGIALYGLVTGLIILLVFVAMVSIVYRSLRNGISPMPSSRAVRRAVAAEINSLNRVRTIVEAGSGWGTLAFSITRQGRKVRRDIEPKIIGLENSMVPLLFSQLMSVMLAEEMVTFVRRDIYRFSYRDADVVVCYLFPRAMQSLSMIFQEQLSIGTRIISICFALPGWVPEKVIVCEDIYHTRIYVYSASIVG
ncbi:hypothetical protein SAMN04488542_1098 [Fontibacillus panacisegetis]|uniref:Methyltransferase domain-containing protein n=1 Tax=Fontibacillus panacisegetis TaxID=670482 RepID=A0A1G7K4E2_9BACL|nr:hypothetical protein [Fontibacillus panacisegetis]SDF31996.1 hypothetical protein SAMN04488542_1098 [Fontibacillus panacisegetis]